MKSLENAAILGIWDGHEAGVSLVAGGRLVFALSEERPSRKKRHSGFPRLALVRALEFADGAGLFICSVAIAGCRGRAPLRILESWYSTSNPHRDPLSLSSRVVAAWENGVGRVPGLRSMETVIGLAPLALRIRDALGFLPRIRTVPHHEAHAHAAMLCPGGPRTIVLTWDAYGEGISGTIRDASDPSRVLRTMSTRASPAALYGAVTVALGFREGDEGKVMGLAARGDPDRGRARFDRMIETREGVPTLRRALDSDGVRRLVDGLAMEDVAAALQVVTEETVSFLIGGVFRTIGEPCRLVASGGLFANIRVNQVLAGLPGVDGLRVFPAMGDGGLAAGAAAVEWRRLTGESPESCRDVFLGTAFSSDALERAARASGMPWTRVPDPGQAAADRLARGEVVAVFAGRDEYGPRALGNRSILFSPESPALADRVNSALERDDFMPFGPAVDARACAGLWRPLSAGTDLATMTVAVDALPALASRCPVAAHLDGTSRPQVVDPATSPGFAAILAAFRERTGLPAVMNTSFNLHGEPIVHTPAQAVGTFRRARFEALYLDDIEIRRPDALD
jgi:carbamoyltransferase